MTTLFIISTNPEFIYSTGQLPFYTLEVLYEEPLVDSIGKKSLIRVKSNFYSQEALESRLNIPENTEIVSVEDAQKFIDDSPSQQIKPKLTFTAYELRELCEQEIKYLDEDKIKSLSLKTERTKEEQASIDKFLTQREKVLKTYDKRKKSFLVK